MLKRWSVRAKSPYWHVDWVDEASFVIAQIVGRSKIPVLLVSSEETSVCLPHWVHIEHVCDVQS